MPNRQQTAFLAAADTLDKLKGESSTFASASAMLRRGLKGVETGEIAPVIDAIEKALQTVPEDTQPHAMMVLPDASASASVQP